MKNYSIVFILLCLLSCATEMSNVKKADNVKNAVAQKKKIICVVNVKENYNDKIINSELKETELLIKRILKSNEKGLYEFNIISDGEKNDKNISLFITGEVVSNRQGEADFAKLGVENMVSISSIIRLQAVDFQKNQVIITVSKQAPGVHLSEKAARKKSIENVLKEVFGRWDEDFAIENEGMFLKKIYEYCEITSAGKK